MKLMDSDFFMVTKIERRVMNSEISLTAERPKTSLPGVRVRIQPGATVLAPYTNGPVPPLTAIQTKTLLIWILL